MNRGSFDRSALPAAEHPVGRVAFSAALAGDAMMPR
jgi:hypothetical protein